MFPVCFFNIVGSIDHTTNWIRKRDNWFTMLLMARIFGMIFFLYFIDTDVPWIYIFNYGTIVLDQCIIIISLLHK